MYKQFYTIFLSRLFVSHVNPTIVQRFPNGIALQKYALSNGALLSTQDFTEPQVETAMGIETASGECLLIGKTYGSTPDVWSLRIFPNSLD